MSKDFHGGRTYAADQPGSDSRPGFSVTRGLAWLGSQLASLFGLARTSTDTGKRIPSANDAEQDAELRLVSMFQVFDGPGGAPTSLGRPRADRRRPAETQDR
jgi:hypothetical protein